MPDIMIFAAIGIVLLLLVSRPLLVLFAPDWIAGPGGCLVDTTAPEADGDGGSLGGLFDGDGGGDGGGD